MDALAKKVAARHLQRQAATEDQKDLKWGIKKLDKSLDDIEEVLIHWAPKGQNSWGLTDDFPDVAKAVAVIRQVGKTLGPEIKKLKKLKL